MPSRDWRPHGAAERSGLAWLRGYRAILAIGSAVIIIAGLGVFSTVSRNSRAEINPYKCAEQKSDKCARQTVAPVSPDERIADYNGLLTLFTFFLALFGAWGIWISSRQIRYLVRADDRSALGTELSLKQFEAEHRPWIAIRDARIISDLVIYRGATALDVEFTIENTGRTPAKDFCIFPFVSMAQDSKIYDAHRDEIVKFFDTGSFSSETIFPRQVVKLTRNFIVTAEMLAKMEQTKVTIYFSPIFYGVMAYRSTFDRKVRHTDFIYFAQIKDKGVVELFAAGAWKEVAADRMELSNWAIGRSAT